jgi:GTP cyclohydrolase I
MPHKRISLTILEVCQKLGINYNPEDKQLFNDAKRLGEIYRELKVITGDLQCISERHDIKDLHLLLSDDIEKISTVEHDIIKIATKIKHE